MSNNFQNDQDTQGFLLEQGELSLPPTGRPVIYSTKGVISSGHYLTSMAGLRMMLEGGNAFDAVVASTIAAAVVEPIASYSLGAESTFMLYHKESGDVLSLSGQGTASGKATPEYFISRGYESIPTGPGKSAPHSFTVPGVVASCLSLLDRYGTMSVEEVFSPAIEYAESGIVNYEYMIGRLGAGDSIKQFELFPPGGLEVFFDSGEIPEAGTILVQKSLGTVLGNIVDSANAAGGSRSDGIKAARDCFYSGEIAEKISECSIKVGGILEKNDLETYVEQYDVPLSVSYMGFDILSHSTWTQGPVLLQALNILENFDLKSMGHNSTEYVHVITEALKLALSDREAFYGDPDFSEIPIDGLMSKEYGVERAKLIQFDRAYPGLPLFGDPWVYSSKQGVASDQPNYMEGGGIDLNHESGTTHISAIDQDGNMVCATPSGGAFNKSVFFPELGFALSTRSEMLNFVEGHPNVVEPMKRPRTTIINYMISYKGTPVATVGCPGGDAQAQANLQMVLNTILWGMNPQEASEAPRFSSLSAPNSFYPHTYLPGQLALEEGFDEAVIEGLKHLGHDIVFSATCGMGATVAKRDPATGVMAAGADPRRACYAIGI
jgi:gamma-glutamyltranspeptidase/glutathione hydrolase|tara:strand:- start:2699 stop:4519 length:1821 start_codon:yes stop_codon:yes gene_type:complete